VWSLPGVHDQIFVYGFYASVVLSRSALFVESVDLSIVRSRRLCRLYTLVDLADFKSCIITVDLYTGPFSG
jgi:hypothetical protein